MNAAFPVRYIVQRNVLVLKAQQAEPARTVEGLHRWNVEVPEAVGRDVERELKAFLAHSLDLIGLLALGDVAAGGEVVLLPLKHNIVGHDFHRIDLSRLRSMPGLEAETLVFLQFIPMFTPYTQLVVRV